MYQAQANGYTGSSALYRGPVLASYLDLQVFLYSQSWEMPSQSWEGYDAESQTWVAEPVLRAIPASASHCTLWVAGATTDTTVNGCYTFTDDKTIDGRGWWAADDPTSSWAIYFESDLWYMSSDPGSSNAIYASAQGSFEQGPPLNGWMSTTADGSGLIPVPGMLLATVSTVVAVPVMANTAYPNLPPTGEWHVLCDGAWIAAPTSILAVQPDTPCYTVISNFAIDANQVCCPDDLSITCDADGMPSVCTMECAMAALPVTTRCMDYIRDPDVGLADLAQFFDSCIDVAGGGGH